ncbi:hypothetical protein FOZ63_027142 [Perkinsus olseni]|uniref:Uncharacterized protein n=1 Tax=Perkinsus olseni TaxID=32597 RepID=A0A7J6QZU7_PEROL|nr:hypothetical protein FOZ63_027142 [Perkinsus olseni]
MANTGTRLVLEAMEMALDILRRVTDNVLEITGDGGSDVSTLNAQTGMVPPEVAVRTVNCCLESRTMLVAARSTVSSGIPREQLKTIVQCFEVLAPATNPATAAEMLETSAVLCLNDGEESTDINQLNKELLLDAGYAGIPVLLLKRWCTLGHNPRLMRQACRAMLLLQYRSANGARHFARLRVHMVLVAEIQPNAKTGGAKALGRILALLADLCAGSTIADETVKKALRDYKTNPVKGQPKSSQTVVDLVLGALEIITQQEPDTPDFECLFQAARLFGAMLSREVPSEPSSESSVAGNASDAGGEAKPMPVRQENQLMTRIEPVMGRYPATEGSELEVSLIVWCLINRRHATGQFGQGKIADRKGICLLNLTTSDRDAFKSWQRGGEVPVETEIYAAFSQFAHERSEARPRLFSMKLFLNLRQYPVAHMLPSSAQRRTPAGLLLVHMFYSRLYRRLEVMAEVGSDKAAIARLGAFFDPVRESELSSGKWGMGWLEVTDFLHDFEIVPTVCGMVVAQRAWLIVTDNDKGFSTRLPLEQLLHFVILLSNYAYSAKKFETPLLMSRVRRFARQLSLNKHKMVKKKLFDAYRDHHKFKYSEYEDFTEIHRRLILKAAPTTVPKLMDRKYIPANEELEAAVRMLSKGCYLDDTVVWEQYRFTHAFDLGVMAMNSTHEFRIDLTNIRYHLQTISVSLATVKGPVAPPLSVEWKEGKSLSPGQTMHVLVRPFTNTAGTEWFGYINILAVTAAGETEVYSLPTYLRIAATYDEKCSIVPVLGPYPFTRKEPLTTELSTFDPSSHRNLSVRRSGEPHVKYYISTPPSSWLSPAPRSSGPVSTRSLSGLLNTYTAPPSRAQSASSVLVPRPSAPLHLPLLTRSIRPGSASRNRRPKSAQAILMQARPET